MDTRRLILLAVFFLSLYMLWTEWERYSNPPPPATAQPTAAAAPVDGAPVVSGALGAPSTNLPPPGGSDQVPTIGASGPSAEAAKPIRIRTDKLVADISPIGGEIVRLELLQHRATESPDRNLLLVDPDHRYAIQSGLIGNGLPTHRAAFRVITSETELGDQPSLVVVLEGDGGPGVTVRKRYEFRRGDYRVLINQQIDNGGVTPLTAHAYYQFQRDGRSPPL